MSIENRPQTRKNIISFIVSVAISVGLLIFLFRYINFHTLKDLFLNLYYPAILVYFALFVSGIAFRTWRYKLMLPGVPIGFFGLAGVTIIRNLFVDFLPARLGELSFIWVLNKRYKVAVELGGSAFIGAFVYDLIALFPLLVIAIGLSPLRAQETGKWLMILFTGAFVFLSVVVVFAKRFLPLVIDLLSHPKIRSFVRRYRFMGVVYEKGIQIIRQLILLGEQGIGGKLFLLSLGVRLSKYISLFFLFFAVVRSMGYTLHSLNPFTVFSGTAFTEVSSLLPIQGLAGLGTWEATWAAVFVFFGFKRETAILSGIGVHWITQITEYSLGILSLIVLFWPASKKEEPWQLSVSKRSLKKMEKVKVLSGYVKGSGRFLEVGCDKGVVGYFLRKKGGWWVSVDADHQNVVDTKALLGEGVVMVAEDLFPFQREVFDHIFCVDFLEHIEDDSACLWELRRALKNGGELLVTVPHWDEGMPLNWLAYRLGFKKEYYGHVRDGYSVDALRSKLEETGFEPFETRTFCRFFTEGIELILNYLYQFVLKKKSIHDGIKGNIAPRKKEDVQKHRFSLLLYKILYPFLKVFSLLDYLIPKNRGYILLIRSRKIEG